MELILKTYIDKCTGKKLHQTFNYETNEYKIKLNRKQLWMCTSEDVANRRFYYEVSKMILQKTINFGEPEPIQAPIANSNTKNGYIYAK